MGVIAEFTLDQIASHPIAECFPSIQGEEYLDFKEDIRKHGIIEPITIYEGKILDGRNRYRVARELGIKFSTQAYNGDSPMEFAWSMNGARRHLTAGQRAAIALELLPAAKAEAAKRQEQAGKTFGRGKNSSATTDAKLSESKRAPRATDQVAHLVGLKGGKSIERTAYVKRYDPEEFERIKSGETTPRAAERKIKARKDDSRVRDKSQTTITIGNAKISAAKVLERTALNLCEPLPITLEPLIAKDVILPKDRNSEFLPPLKEAVRLLRKLIAKLEEN